MADKFRLQEVALDSPAQEAYLVSPSDTEDLPLFSRAIFMNNGGPVKMELVNNPGSPITLTLAAGTIFPFRVRRIWSTGTTATEIYCLM